MTPAKRELTIGAEGFSLPTDFATKSIAILAQRRKGKTYTASVLAEECVACEIPFVALDPTGAWWGLRASADGKREGLPVYVFGGQHASDPDMKLERTAGKEIARFVVDYPGYYVVDFKSFESKEAERQFATDFGEEIYAYKQRRGKDFVQHVFVDEADMFVPQERKGVERMLGAYESIVRRGGILGLGTSLISQRTAIVNKNVLEQVDTLIVLRTIGPNDREAIRKYAVANGTPEQMDALMGSLASLRLGEAWVYEPGADPALFERIQIRERRTFNSSATPKPGEKRVEPKQLAGVELKALRERMAASIEKAKAENPKLLTKRIAELERELRNAKSAAATVEVEKVVEVPVPLLDPKLIKDLERVVERAYEPLNKVHGAYDRLHKSLLEAAELVAAANGSRPKGGAHAPTAVATQPVRRRESAETARPATSPVAPLAKEKPQPLATSHSGSVSRPQQAILDALAWLQQVGQDPARRTAVALVAGVSTSSSGYANNLGAMKSAGLIDYPQGGYVQLTSSGAAAARIPDEVPDEAELQRRVFERVGGSKAEILRQLVAVYPDALPRDELAAKASASPSSSGYANNLGALRTLGLLDYPQKGFVAATDALFIGGRA